MNNNQKLASNLINYSCKLKKGEKVFIYVSDSGNNSTELVNEIIAEAGKVGAYAFPVLENPKTKREWLLNVTDEQLEETKNIYLPIMESMDAYIRIAAGENKFELSDVPEDRIKAFTKICQMPIVNTRVTKKWVILGFPTQGMAQSAEMSTKQFEEFYYNVCTLDYNKMNNAMDSLKNLMDRTDKVRLVAKDTDLSFSIKDIPSIKCAGECNIPDGEVYTAPVKNSVNGVITYNAPSVYDGVCFENVRLVFKDGKIIEATSNNTERINQIFDTDEGARYVGEFAIGVNPFVTKPMKEILFDEKIRGSIHFTPGMAYEDANNGNVSDIHWDLVLIMTEEYGGGQIYFDDVLIRDNGIFVLPELECLNPENLI